MTTPPHTPPMAASNEAEPDQLEVARAAAKRVPRAGASPSPSPRQTWTRSQQDLAVIYNARGMSPEEIAGKLGLSRSTVTQMILAAKRPAKP